MVEVLVGYPSLSASGWNMHPISSLIDSQAGQMMQLACKEQEDRKELPRKADCLDGPCQWIKSILKPTSKSIFQPYRGPYWAIL